MNFSIIVKTIVTIFILSTYNVIAQNKDQKNEAPQAAGSDQGTLTGKDLFKDLFSKKLEETDFILCSSKISLIKVDTSNNKKNEVFIEEISRRGKNGNSLYLDLQSAIEKQKAEVISNCKKEKSTASCVKNTLIKNQSEYQLLDFKARKSFLEAIESDCDTIKFDCEEVKSTEIKCDLYQSPDLVITVPTETQKTPEVKK